MSLLNAWLLLLLSVGSIQPWKWPLIDKYKIKVLNSVNEKVAVECKTQNGGIVGKKVHQLKEGSEFWFTVQKKLFNQNDVYTCTAIWENHTATFPAFNKKIMADNSFDLRPDGVHFRDNNIAPWSPMETREVKAEAKRDLFSDMHGLIQTRLGAMMSDPSSVVSMVRSSAGTGGNVAVAVAHQAAKRQVNNAMGFGKAEVTGGSQPPVNNIPVNLPQLPQLPNNNVIVPVQPPAPPPPIGTAVGDKPLGPNDVGPQCPSTTPNECTSTTEGCKSGKKHKKGNNRKQGKKKGCGKGQNKLQKKMMKAQKKADRIKAKLENS